MPEQHYPDLEATYEADGTERTATATWTGECWEQETSAWAIRLWPKPSGVSANGFLFEADQRRRYQLAKQALILEARKLTNQERYA
jgi:hypothetical protein